MVPTITFSLEEDTNGRILLNAVGSVHGLQAVKKTLLAINSETGRLKRFSAAELNGLDCDRIGRVLLED